MDCHILIQVFSCCTYECESSSEILSCYNNWNSEFYLLQNFNLAKLFQVQSKRTVAYGSLTLVLYILVVLIYIPSCTKF